MTLQEIVVVLKCAHADLVGLVGEMELGDDAPARKTIAELEWALREMGERV